MRDVIEQIVGEFWTQLDELVADIEQLGLTVDEAYDEYIAVTNDDDKEAIIYLGHAGRTMWIERIREWN